MANLQKIDGLSLTMPDVSSQAAPFGQWILQQKERGGFPGALTKAATWDRRIARGGCSDAVRKRLNEQVGDAGVRVPAGPDQAAP